MLQKIRSYIERQNLIQPGDHVIAGVSGGADSICLLLVLKDLETVFGFSLSAVHVEHGIRGEESRHDAVFTEDICRKEKVPCRIFSVNVPSEAEKRHLGMEETARILRYECLKKAADECPPAKIAVAHHMEDAAETVLFHLCRGTGIRGLAGIPPRRGNIIRPLLCVTRAEIETFLKDRKQSFCTDVTNADIEYSRNRIRQNILPEMRKINRQAELHMLETAEEVSEIADFLEKEAIRQGEPGTRRTPGGILILREPFLKMDPVLQSCRIHQLLGEAAGNRKDLTRRNIADVIRLFSMQTGREIMLPYHLSARSEYEGVRILNPKTTADPDSPSSSFTEMNLCEGLKQHWEGPDGSIFQTDIFSFDGDEKKIPRTRYTKWFDYDKLKGSLQIRFRQAGDYLQISSRGGKKKLKEWMINEKIPSRLRDRIPLVAIGSHILWITGYRSSEAFHVTARTRRVLEICLLKEADTNE